MMQVVPGLFGITHSNRNFEERETWGKNQFNSSFPAALCCYLDHKNLDTNYLSVDSKGNLSVLTLSVENLFTISPKSEKVFYAFESMFAPYQRYVVGSLPRTDLVIQNNTDGSCLRSLEVKLTALPDNTTCSLIDSKYGSEIVVRPDTIVYLACSIISQNLDLEKELNLNVIKISDWSNHHVILENIQQICLAVENIARASSKNQIPFLLQPIWKTTGKSPKLADSCLDVFVWSNAGFSWFISQICNRDCNAGSITRHTRTAVWLYKMLFDFHTFGHFDHEKIIDELSYNTKNDKAFASSGNITNKYMQSPNLTNPRIHKNDIKNIILGGGQNLLSPERRFDAIIYNSPELFI